jgi:hypothetical protein
VTRLEELVVLVALGLYTLLVGGAGLIALGRPASPGEEAETSPRAAWAWLAGSFGGLAIVAGVTMLANPRGYYPVRLLRPRIESMRPIRADAYAARPGRPDLVVMGSSRAFPLPPTYIQATTGLSASNLSVEEGSIEDFVAQARFMMAQKDHHLPRVLLVDLSPPPHDQYRGASRTAVLSPLRLIPFLSPAARERAVRQQLDSLLNGQHLAEALYTLLHFDQHRLRGPTLEFPRWVFDADGEGRHRPADFQADLDHFIRHRGVPACETLGDWFRDNVNDLVSLTRQDGASVVFYMGPRHPAFYDAVWKKNPRFQRCYSAFNAFLTGLAGEDGVYFLDLLDVRSFSGVPDLGPGFYDDHHPGPTNARLMIDAAAPTLRRAYAAARKPG